MIDFSTTKLPKGEFHLACYLIRLHTLQQALSHVPKTSSYHARKTSIATALDDLESFLLLTTGKPLRPVILSVVSEPLNRWIKTTIDETKATADSEYHPEYVQRHLSALVKYGKRSAKLLPQSDRYRLLKLLARICPQTDCRVLRYGDLEDDFEREFLVAVEDAIQKSWSQFAPIPRDSWRSLPSMVEAFAQGRNYVPLRNGGSNSEEVHRRSISTAA